MSANNSHTTKTTKTNVAGVPPAPPEAHQKAGLSATYSPDDNKLRLYAVSRLDAETYNRVREAGFKWAPKQELFVAPMWTPAREDLLIELCGYVGDEDTSLIERAEERADRFEDYSGKRAADAHRAREAVAAISDGIPLGQPILIGHHSERRARKDAQRIENGIRQAVQMWRTSEYWTARAAGALHHAKYKELPGVRARRIKGLEADKRKKEREIAESEKFLTLWRSEGLTQAQAIEIANYDYVRVRTADDTYASLWSLLSDGKMTATEATARAEKAHTRAIAWARRWLEHFENRIAYERALLEEQGASELLQPKPKKALLPLCNYRAPEGITIPHPYHRGQMITYPQVEMTKAEYAAICNDYKGVRTVPGSHRFRTAMIKGHQLVSVFLTDSKTHEPPAAEAAPTETVPASEPAPRIMTPKAENPEADTFKAMSEQLKQGVQVVSAPQLFPTPAPLAARMVQLAQVEKGMTVLEPSAGTGRILHAINDALGGGAVRTAIEINYTLCQRLRIQEAGAETYQRDFLQCTVDEFGTFQRILMNPPFEKGQDIAHIKHALTMLASGGRLVAICANGPRQAAQLRPLVEEHGGTWEELPADTFAESGTNVRTVLIVIDKD